MIVVTTPTGQIGSQVVKLLLNAGESVRVVARDPAKLAPEMQGKVEVVQGSTDDEGVLRQALDGAESLFWLVPPSFQATDAVEHYLSFTRPLCRVLQSHPVKRVVAVSALGRGTAMEDHAGLVTGAFASDKAIERTGVDFRALACPGFIDNVLWQVQPLRSQGMYFLPSLPDVAKPQVATRDIAAMAASLLLDRAWTGQGSVAVLGPEDLSYNDMAQVMTDVLGKPIRFQPLSADAAKAQMTGMGASEEFVQDYVDMFEAKDNGLDNAVPRTAENTTPTSFRQWCEEVLRPAVLK